jgi:hypothetical protein
MVPTLVWFAVLFAFGKIRKIAISLKSTKACYVYMYLFSEGQISRLLHAATKEVAATSSYTKQNSCTTQDQVTLQRYRNW